MEQMALPVLFLSNGKNLTTINIDNIIIKKTSKTSKSFLYFQTTHQSYISMCSIYCVRGKIIILPKDYGEFYINVRFFIQIDG